MSLNPKWVPMKWPCGPIAVARLNDENGGDAELRECAAAWARPAALDLLTGTPVNCLIVEWAAGAAGDSAQQQSLRALIAAGRQKGISFVGKVSTTDQVAISAGAAAGLEAVILSQPETSSSALPQISLLPSDQIDWGLATPIFIAGGNVWPGTNLKPIDENMDGDAAVAGPTSNPWADSNSWLSLLARSMTPDKVLWLDLDPPDPATLLPAQRYCLAVADTALYGSRWILSLDNRMRVALHKREAPAIAAWKQISDTVAYFEAHPSWITCEPMGVLAVVSDFSQQNAFTTEQVLNLLSRREVPFTVMNRTRPLPLSDAWLRGILWLDDEEPEAEQRRELLAFVEQGGQLIASQYWGPAEIAPQTQDWLNGYNQYALGRGRIVVAEGGFPDPYQLSRDTHLIVSRKNDFVRLYNPGTTKYYSTIDQQRRRQVVHVLNYSTEAANYVTLWVNARTNAAQLWSPHSPRSSAIPQLSAADGMSFQLPSIAVNCAVEIDRVI